MEYKKFSKINNIIAAVVFAVASFVYLSTIEPTASFWDCGEFIASSYKLEVGHPPGNPVFQLIARFFTLFADKDHAAMMINAMSALCSSLTIMFLYLTIVHFARRITGVRKKDGQVAPGIAWAMLASGVIGSMAYCFSDTFWFSAVEGEVYAMSSLFTAVVVWCMLKWEEEADCEYANRWIVLIALLMGLSIGVHLLNLLTIPALVFVYYYKKFKVSVKGSIVALLASGIILAVILFGIIPYVPKTAALFDRLFVNVFGLGFNSGALFFIVALFAVSFFLIYWSYKHEKVLLNTIMLCFTMIIIGYSAFAVVVIRSSANTPTNENAPDNPYSLVSYIGREQYGKTPLLVGQTYATPYSLEGTEYYTRLGDRYIKTKGPLETRFDRGGLVFFPRMWSGSSDTFVTFYNTYSEGRGTRIEGSDKLIPTPADNLRFFFDYQLNWMYFRYFMWNFVGRQNDIQGSVPGDVYRGNWESGIGFIDRARLGDQSEGPDYIVNSASKNHYFFLPLILGLIGLFFQLSKDQRNWWITTLLFVLTGIAIVVYLNQTPYQARERDYAYAGSFYAFAIWIGLAVMAVYSWISKLKTAPVVTAALATLICLPAPVIMAAENWDDHDRSNRTTARDMAVNYLESCGQNAILLTHGDNDTFPLWYAQEVEEVRTDVRIFNTSLGQTDWYIDQMKWKQYDSDPLPISLDRSDYLYGTNDFIEILPRLDQRISAKELMTLFKDPRMKLDYGNGTFIKFLPTRKYYIPVNKDNAVKCGLISAEMKDSIPDRLDIDIPEGKTYLTKQELIMLDVLSNYDWERPICMVQMGGDINIGLKDYLRFDGFVHTFVPVKGTMSMAEGGNTDVDKMYDLFMNGYALDNLASDKIHVDYQNLYTFNGSMSIRSLFAQTARKMWEKGDGERTVALLDRMQEVMVDENFPLSSTLVPSYNGYAVVTAIDLYYRTGEIEKAKDLSSRYIDSVCEEIRYFAGLYSQRYASGYELEEAMNTLYILVDVFNMHHDKEMYDKIMAFSQELAKMA